VWLGWFLEANLSRFADDMREPELAAAWRRGAIRLRASLEAEAWDGDWYRRFLRRWDTARFIGQPGMSNRLDTQLFAG